MEQPHAWMAELGVTDIDQLLMSYHDVKPPPPSHSDDDEDFIPMDPFDDDITRQDDATNSDDDLSSEASVNDDDDTNKSIPGDGEASVNDDDDTNKSIPGDGEAFMDGDVGDENNDNGNDIPSNGSISGEVTAGGSGDDDTSSSSDTSEDSIMLEYNDTLLLPGGLYVDDAETELRGIIYGLVEMENQLHNATLRDVLCAVCPVGTSEQDVATKCIACLLVSPGYDNLYAVNSSFPLIQGLNVPNEMAETFDEAWTHLLNYYARVENTFMTRATWVDADPISRNTVVPLHVVESLFDENVVDCYKATLATNEESPMDGTVVPWWLSEFATHSMDVNLTDIERGRINHFMGERMGRVDFQHALFLLGDVLNRQAVAPNNIGCAASEWGPVFTLVFYMAHSGMFGSDNVFLKRPDLITETLPIPYPFGVVPDETSLDRSYKGPVNEATRFRMRYDTGGLQWFTINHMFVGREMEYDDGDDKMELIHNDLFVDTRQHETFLFIPASEFAFATLDMTVQPPDVTLNTDSELHTFIAVYTNGGGFVAPDNIIIQRIGSRSFDLIESFNDASQFINGLFCAFHVVIQWQCGMVPLNFMYGKELWLRDHVANFALMYAMVLDHYNAATGKSVISENPIYIVNSNETSHYDYKGTKLAVPQQHVIFLINHIITSGNNAHSAGMLKEILTRFLHHYILSPIEYEKDAYPVPVPWLDTSKYFDTEPQPSMQFYDLEKIWRENKSEIVDMESARNVFETHILPIVTTQQ